MTFTEIKDQVTLRTQCKVQQMKQRYLVLPERIIDRCELCDQLSQEIYDYAVATLIHIVDRNHLRYNLDALLNALHQDFCRLSNDAIEVLFARQQQEGRLNKEQNTVAGLTPARFETKDNPPALLAQVWLKPFQFLLTWLKGWHRSALAATLPLAEGFDLNGIY